jgi:hypothetical protein
MAFDFLSGGGPEIRSIQPMKPSGFGYNENGIRQYNQPLNTPLISSRNRVAIFLELPPSVLYGRRFGTKPLL